MIFAPGARLGSFEILAPLGAGGMGEVYKARDTRLDRQVAIKVLPEHLSASRQASERFAREAKTISRLSHPHICALYDVGREGDTDFLVMELLEGETLARRLERGALPLEQTLRFGIEIADALDKAHRQGIVHRDLKPANVMLTRSGVKLLDFGLAKAMTPDAERTAMAGMPTLDPLTGEGTLLGTVQYMAPEQLDGREADARADLFALGLVLYEMATGTRAFTGKSHASLVSAILRDEPVPIATLQPLAPPALERVVATCLAKDRDERVQTAHDVKLQLQWIAGGSSQSGRAVGVTTTRRRGREQLAWGLAGASLLAAALLGVGYLRHDPAPAPVARASILFPAGTTIASNDPAFALSPDGRQLAIAGSSADGPRQLWLKSLEGGELRPLADTEGALSPFWSPDSRQIGFFAGHKLEKIPATGGAVVPLADVAEGRGASWSRDDVIVFAPAPLGRGLSRVSAAGGEVTVLTEVPKDVSHQLPWFLPDGKHLLFVSSHWPNGKDDVVEVLDLGTGKTTPLMRASSEVRYVDPGYLLFIRDSNLMAQPFDARRLRTTGAPVPIAEKVQFYASRLVGNFSVSDNGLLVYEDASAVLRQLTWFDLDGKKLGTTGEPAFFRRLAIAPDARRAVVLVSDAAGIWRSWLFDLDRGVATPLDRPGVAGSSFRWVWSPDSRNLAVENEGGTSILVLPADGSAPARTVVAGLFSSFPTSWSPDGRTLALRVFDVKSGSADVWTVSASGEGSAHPYFASLANETQARFSPDGGLLAYFDDRSGQAELYVARYTGSEASRGVRVSKGGVNSLAHWLGSGRVAYLDPMGRRLVAVDVGVRDGALEVGPTQQLFGGQRLPDGPFDVTRDGKRLLIAVSVDESWSEQMSLVTNWTQLLEHR